MRAIKAVVLLGFLTVLACVIGQAAAASAATTSVRCSLHAQLKTGQLSEKGALVGSVTCGHPFGNGGYHGRYRDKVIPSPLSASEAGSSNLSFNAGTVRGTYVIGQAPLSGTAPYHGTFHIIGGTGRFKHVSGTLKMTCAHHAPPLTACTVSGPASGI